MLVIMVGALFAVAMVANANAAIKLEAATYTDGETTMKGFVRVRRRRQGQAARDRHGA